MSELHKPINSSTAVTVSDMRNSNFICSVGQVDGMSGWLASEGVAYLADAQTFTNVNTFSGNNIFSGQNTFSNSNTFSGNNTFSGDNVFSGANSFSKPITNAFGVITTSQPSVISQTWNAAGVTFDAFSIDITSTASASGSRGFRVRFDGTTSFSVRKDGQVTIASGGLEVNSGTVNIYSGNIYVSGSFFTAGGAVSFSYQNNYSGSMIATAFPSGSSYAWSGTMFNTSRTSNLTLAGNFTDIGLVIDNEGASGAVVITLPAASVGLHYMLVVVANQSLSFDAAGTDVIRDAGSTSSAGGTIGSSTIGNVVHLYCPTAGVWFVIKKVGTWTLT